MLRAPGKSLRSTRFSLRVLNRIQCSGTVSINRYGVTKNTATKWMMTMIRFMRTFEAITAASRLAGYCVQF